LGGVSRCFPEASTQLPQTTQYTALRVDSGTGAVRTAVDGSLSSPCSASPPPSSRGFFFLSQILLLPEPFRKVLQNCWKTCNKNSGPSEGVRRESYSARIHGSPQTLIYYTIGSDHRFGQSGCESLGNEVKFRLDAAFSRFCANDNDLSVLSSGAASMGRQTAIRACCCPQRPGGRRLWLSGRS